MSEALVEVDGGRRRVWQIHGLVIIIISPAIDKRWAQVRGLLYTRSAMLHETVCCHIIRTSSLILCTLYTLHDQNVALCDRKIPAYGQAQSLPSAQPSAAAQGGHPVNPATRYRNLTVNLTKSPGLAHIDVGPSGSPAHTLTLSALTALCARTADAFSVSGTSVPNTCSLHSIPDADAYDPAAGKAREDELTQLLDKVSIPALTARASDLRDGIACSVPTMRYDRSTWTSVMGGMNYHIPISFVDGVTWLARIRRFNAASPPPPLRDYIIQSEVATLRFLEQTSVPAPKVFDFRFEEETNPVGVGYILLEKMPGKTLKWTVATHEQKTVVLMQLADTFIELQKHPFDLVGCLIGPDNLRIGALADESMTDFVDTQIRPLGPFSSVLDYHYARVHLVLDLVLRDEIYAGRAIDAYLVHRFLLDLVPAISQSVNTDGRFYLMHPDDKGDHILVDEHFNITGIIDWEWAHTFPMEAAFNSPTAFLDVQEFYSGNNDLSDDERSFAQILENKGSADLAQAVRLGRLQHRFAFCCNGDLEDWSGFVGLFKALRNAARVDEDLEWDDWKSFLNHPRGQTDKLAHWRSSSIPGNIPDVSRRPHAGAVRHRQSRPRYYLLVDQWLKNTRESRMIQQRARHCPAIPHLQAANKDNMSQQEGEPTPSSSARTPCLNPASPAFRITLKMNGIIMDEFGRKIPSDVKELVTKHIRKERASPPRLQDEQLDSIRDSIEEIWDSGEAMPHTILQPPLFALKRPGVAQGPETLWSTTPLPRNPDFPTCLPAPKTDLHFGFRPSTKSNWTLAEITVAEHPRVRPYSQSTRESLFPSFLVEFKSEATSGALYAAEGQLASSGAHRVNSLLWMLDQINPQRTRSSADALVFSAAVSQREAIAHVHYFNPADGNYYMSWIDSFPFAKDAQGCCDYTTNVCDWLLDVQQPIIREALAKLHPISKAWGISESGSPSRDVLEPSRSTENEQPSKRSKRKRTAEKHSRPSTSHHSKLQSYLLAGRRKSSIMAVAEPPWPIQCCTDPSKYVGPTTPLGGTFHLRSGCSSGHSVYDPRPINSSGSAGVMRTPDCANHSLMRESGLTRGAALIVWLPLSSHPARTIAEGPQTRTIAFSTMVKEIMEDSDMPEPLNTAKKQEKRAKQLAAAALGKNAHQILPSFQGCFSRTQIVKMVGGQKIVIQFRVEPLDTKCFERARSCLGDVVPSIQRLEDEELEGVCVTPYLMSHIPGVVWFRVNDEKVEDRVKIASSLGSILGRGFVQSESSDVVDTFVLPALRLIHDSLNTSTDVLRPHLERLVAVASAPAFKLLPLWISHFDLNEMNVLIDEEYNVSGVVDWELSRDLPFGTGLHRICDTIVGRNSKNRLIFPAGADKAEAAFWAAIWKEMPAAARRSIDRNLESFAAAMNIGSLLFACLDASDTAQPLVFQEPSAARLGFLEAVLTYRPPQTRGEAAPFAETFISVPRIAAIVGILSVHGYLTRSLVEIVGGILSSLLIGITPILPLQIFQSTFTSSMDKAADLVGISARRRQCTRSPRRTRCAHLFVGSHSNPHISGDSQRFLVLTDPPGYPHAACRSVGPLSPREVDMMEVSPLIAFTAAALPPVSPLVHHVPRNPNAPSASPPPDPVKQEYAAHLPQKKRRIDNWLNDLRPLRMTSCPPKLEDSNSGAEVEGQRPLLEVLREMSQLRQQNGPATELPSGSPQTSRTRPSDPKYRGILKHNGVSIDRTAEKIPPELRSFLDLSILKERSALPPDAIAKVVELAGFITDSVEVSISRLLHTVMVPVQRFDVGDGGNTPWYRNNLPKSKGFTAALAQPRADYHFGYLADSRSTWTKQELAVVDHPQAAHITRPARGNCFPFLVLEFKSEAMGGNIWQAENQVAGSGASCVNAMRWLYREARRSETQSVVESIAFSACITQREVVFYVNHFSVADDRHYLSCIGTFQTTCEVDIQRCHNVVSNIFDYALGMRQEKTREALKLLYPIPEHWKQSTPHQ
ncbi:hypothetical protein FH972_024136 [Carpinus fangiana]|uniref:Uncharacterized protein n=1 Tax=Carpinus fangiana TaxID=176857 RepID=A0A5N6KX54_9ROSI|nr:hypothetical protein FH972_024136 [Carpinus fangiana]